jgi:hypothetical protein
MSRHGNDPPLMNLGPPSRLLRLASSAGRRGRARNAMADQPSDRRIRRMAVRSRCYRTLGGWPDRTRANRRFRGAERVRLRRHRCRGRRGAGPTSLSGPIDSPERFHPPVRSDPGRGSWRSANHKAPRCRKPHTRESGRRRVLVDRGSGDSGSSKFDQPSGRDVPRRSRRRPLSGASMCIPGLVPQDAAGGRSPPVDLRSPLQACIRLHASRVARRAHRAAAR